MNLEEITKEVLAVVKTAADFISVEAKKFDPSCWSGDQQRQAIEKVEIKSLNSLVSYVDVTAEKMLVEGLKNILPDSGFITEENTISKTEKKQRWIIDPLDGTTNFIHGVPAYCVSVALMQDEELIIGVVHEVSRNESFYAWKNSGAFLNGKNISVSNTKKLSDSLVATGFPYEKFEYLKKYSETLSQFMMKTRGVRRIGSAALDLCYVACGRFDGFFEYNLNAWDVAGGSLIVKEAGGTVSDFKNRTDFLFGREILATNKKIHEEMRQLI